MGQVLSTLILSLVILVMYGAVLYHVYQYSDRIRALETEIDNLKTDLRALTLSLKLTNAASEGQLRG